MGLQQGEEFGYGALRAMELHVLIRVRTSHTASTPFAVIRHQQHADALVSGRPTADLDRPLLTTTANCRCPSRSNSILSPKPPKSGECRLILAHEPGTKFAFASATRPQPNAWFRCAIRSSGSSIPTEMRISAGVIPSRTTAAQRCTESRAIGTLERVGALIGAWRHNTALHARRLARAIIAWE